MLPLHFPRSHFVNYKHGTFGRVTIFFFFFQQQQQQKMCTRYELNAAKVDLHFPPVELFSHSSHFHNSFFLILMHLSNWNLNIAPKYIHLPKRKKRRNQAALHQTTPSPFGPLRKTLLSTFPSYPPLPYLNRKCLPQTTLDIFTSKKKTCSPPEKKNNFNFHLNVLLARALILLRWPKF